MTEMQFLFGTFVWIILNIDEFGHDHVSQARKKREMKIEYDYRMPSIQNDFAVVVSFMFCWQHPFVST